MLESRKGNPAIGHKRKVKMFNLEVRHGLRSAHRQYMQAPSVAELKRDDGLRAELGYGDNCKVLINGVEQPDFITVPGPSVTIETAANQKAQS